MGIDWYPYKPRRDEDRERIAVLAKIQADAFQAMPEYWCTDPFPRYSHERYERDCECHRAMYEDYRAASEELTSLIDFGMSDEHPEYVDGFTVSPMVEWIFPPQWRMAAYRTILPAELPGQIGLWERWLDSVRRGELRRYMVDLYLYEMSMQLLWAWEELREAADYVSTLTNRWTRRPHCIAVREEIAALPRPAVFGAPIRFPEHNLDQDPTEQQLETLRMVEEEARKYRRIALQWSRNTKKAPVGYYSLGDFAEYLESTDKPLLGEFFVWGRKWESRKYGLYLDY